MQDRPVPTPERPWVLLGISVALLLGVLGFTIGRQASTGTAPPQPIAPGTLVELQMAEGRVLLGIFVTQADGRLALSDPAEVVPTESGEGLDVRPLARRPASIDGHLLVERSQVLFVGAVRPGTSLSEAYVEATGVDFTAPTPTPLPTD